MRGRIVPIALVGFLLLGACSDGDDDDSEGTTPATDVVATTAAPATTVAATTTTEPPATTTTLALVTEGATVVVANSSIVGGAAGRMTDELAGAGFTTGTATNGTDRLEDSIVYFTGDDGAEAVAESVGLALGGVTVEALPDPIPTETGTLDDGQVLVMLGNNQADRTLAELSGADAPEPIENAGSVVVVANASGIDGSAGQMTDELVAVGFETGTPTNGIEQRAASIVYFTDADGAEADAELVAEALGGVDVEAIPDEIPTEDGELDGDILVLLGTNEAGSSLASLNP